METQESCCTEARPDRDDKKCPPENKGHEINSHSFHHAPHQPAFQNHPGHHPGTSLPCHHPHCPMHRQSPHHHPPGGMPCHPQPPPPHPLPAEEKLAQIIAIVNGVGSGEPPDVPKIMNLISGIGSQFWKGALLGALSGLVFTNEKVRTALMNALTGATGEESEEKKEEEKKNEA